MPELLKAVMLEYVRHEIELCPDRPQHDEVEVMPEVAKRIVRRDCAQKEGRVLRPEAKEECKHIQLGRIELHVVQQF